MQFITKQDMLRQTALFKGNLFIWWYATARTVKGLGSVQSAGLYRGRISLFLLIWRPYSHYSHWTTGWRDRIGKRGSERGVIGVHALCIISYSEEDSAASGNESGRRCTEVNAGNANEGAAFAGRYIWLKAQVMVNTAQWCYQQKKKKKKQSKGRLVEFFGGIFGSAEDKRCD